MRMNSEGIEGPRFTFDWLLFAFSVVSNLCWNHLVSYQAHCFRHREGDNCLVDAEWLTVQIRYDPSSQKKLKISVETLSTQWKKSIPPLILRLLVDDVLAKVSYDKGTEMKPSGWHGSSSMNETWHINVFFYSSFLVIFFSEAMPARMFLQI